jgi:hypothetical protein
VNSDEFAVAIELFDFEITLRGFGFESPQLHQPVAPAGKTTQGLKNLDSSAGWRGEDDSPKATGRSPGPMSLPF